MRAAAESRKQRNAGKSSGFRIRGEGGLTADSRTRGEHIAPCFRTLSTYALKIARSLRSLRTIVHTTPSLKISPEDRSHDEIYTHRIPALTKSLGKSKKIKRKNH
jgi:hypothetical protein